MNVRSVRPVAPKITTVGAKVGAVVTGPNPSLRGMASEYFVAPDDRGARIEVPEGTAEAMSSRAQTFCRSRAGRSLPTYFAPTLQIELIWQAANHTGALLLCAYQPVSRE